MANNTNEKKMKNGSGHEQHSELQSDANRKKKRIQNVESFMGHIWILIKEGHKLVWNGMNIWNLHSNLNI